MRFTSSVAVLAACAIAAAASAAAAKAVKEFVPEHPSWDAAPSAAYVQAVYPHRALEQGIAGRVLLHCAVEPDASLGDCKVTSEAPLHQGFGSAALRIASKFRFSMDTVDPQVFGNLYVDVPVAFTPSGAPAAIEQPQWTHVLPADKVQAVFPSRAADAGLSTGTAVLNCTANTEGMMTGCQVAEETPAGMDFGPAALRVASVMGVNPWTPDGRPADGAHVRFTLRLNRGN